MKKHIFLILILIIFLNIYNVTSRSGFNDYTSYIYPTIYTTVSSYYGNRILNGYENFHNGTDFLAPMNSEIYATKSGYIEVASFLENGYGNTIIINHGNSIKSLYCHVSEIFIVSVGDFVNQGDTISYVGPKVLSSGIPNGNTTGPHLHFSIFVNGKTIDPLTLIQ